MAVIKVQRKSLTLVERTYFPQVFGALMTTLKHFLGPAETMEYPEQRPAIPAHYRGVPTLVMDPNGREKWSRWEFDEAIAVGRPVANTGTTNSCFSFWERWLAASIRPDRPKNGSVPTTDSASSPSAPNTSSPRSIHWSWWARAPSGVPR